MNASTGFLHPFLLITSLLTLFSTNGLLNAQTVSLPPPEIITARQGLPQAFVPAIVQDKRGFIWMATRDGLARYDGYTFRVFQPTTDGRPSLSSPGLTNLVMAPDGYIWISSDQRDLDGFDPVSETFLNLSHQPYYRQAFGHDTLDAVYPDHHQQLWLVFRQKGVVRFDLKTNRFRRFTHQPANPQSLGSNAVNDVTEDGRSVVWVATDRGLDRFDEKTGTFTHFQHQPGQPNTIPDNRIKHLYRRANGDLWLFSASHLTRWNPQTGLAQTFPLAKPNPYVVLGHQAATDGQGNDYLRLEEQLFLYTDQTGLSALTAPGAVRVFVSLFIDRSDALWVGTDLAGVYKFNLRAAAFTARPYRRSFPNDLLTEYLNIPANKGPDWPVGASPYNFRATTDSTHHLWVTVGGRAMYRVDGNITTAVPFPVPLPDYELNRPTPLATDPDGQLWVVHPDWSGYYQPASGQWTRFVYPLRIGSSMLQTVVDRQFLWIATASMGLYRVNRHTGQTTRFGPQPRDTTSLSSNSLYWLSADPLDPNLLWVGTFGSGLCRFDKRTGRCQRITTRQGLPNNVIYAVIPDRQGSVWVATNQGLGQLDRRTGHVRVYTQEDGLSADEFNRFHAVSLPDGRIGLGGVQGLTGFDPARIRPDTFQPRVQLAGLLVNNRLLTAGPLTGGKSINELTQLTLPHDQNFVTARFAAMQYNRLGRTQYRYQLMGLTSGWVVTDRPEAIYTALAPGDYQLRIQAANTAGQWSRYTYALGVTIRPPWWRTGWAWLGYILLGAGLLWAFVRYRTGQERDKQLRRAEQREADQLRVVDEMKTRFFANITHEFRTPLTLILSPVGALLTELSQSRHGAQLSLIERNARQLLGLVNQLMDLARLDARYMPVNIVRSEPDAVVARVVDTFGAAASAGHVQLGYQAGGVGVYWLDADKLTRIVTNLVANALKFTPGTASQPGRVLVTLHGNRDAPGVRLTVADSGIGIAPEHLPHLFDRFYQVDERHSPTRPAGDGTSYQPPGTGIGLALVKELVDLQQGQIRVESQPGQGTTFRVELPYQPATDTPRTTPPANPEPDRPTEPPDTEPAVLLLVEDNDEMARFISQSLPGVYQVHRAVDGLDGLEQARQLLPDLIISDVMMPRMDGYALCQHLKTDPGTDHIPVVLLTAKVSLNSRLRGLALGADAYLDKPFHVAELQLRVRNLLATQRRLSEQLRAELQSPVATPDGVHPFLQTLYQVLEQHLDDTAFGPEELAAHANMSRMQLYRKLKTLAGLPATDFIRSYRLKRSVALLQQGVPVAQTAYAVGFESASYFGQCFREQFGDPPSRFMNKAN